MHGRVKGEVHKEQFGILCKEKLLRLYKPFKHCEIEEDKIICDYCVDTEDDGWLTLR
jgi:hypothetical protein